MDKLNLNIPLPGSDEVLPVSAFLFRLLSCSFEESVLKQIIQDLKTQVEKSPTIAVNEELEKMVHRGQLQGSMLEDYNATGNPSSLVTVANDLRKILVDASGARDDALFYYQGKVQFEAGQASCKKFQAHLERVGGQPKVIEYSDFYSDDGGRTLSVVDRELATLEMTIIRLRQLAEYLNVTGEATNGVRSAIVSPALHDLRRMVQAGELPLGLPKIFENMDDIASIISHLELNVEVLRPPLARAQGSLQDAVENLNVKEKFTIAAANVETYLTKMHLPVDLHFKEEDYKPGEENAPCVVQKELNRLTAAVNRLEEIAKELKIRAEAAEEAAAVGATAAEAAAAAAAALPKN